MWVNILVLDTVQYLLLSYLKKSTDSCSFIRRIVIKDTKQDIFVIQKDALALPKI